ncbi:MULTISPECIES: hypothetical protein [unclassified Microcoleus]|uniref:hypothetical protein n=1 Tax=unclassified Microcoleus TaxID=2642155 RepID=UPI0025E2044A|nr:MULTISPECIES: hypothetical protein [unclassified Microcoleus]
MKSKWTVYIGILLSILAIIVAVTTPEVRQFFGFETNQSSKDAEIKEVPVIVRTESSEPLAGVKVEFTSHRGIAATAVTESNGYVMVKIPSTRDLQITLRKEGFETISEIVDLKGGSVVAKTYTLKSTSKSTSFSTPPISPDKPTPVPVGATSTEPSPTPTRPSPTQISAKEPKPPKVECKTFGGTLASEGEYTEIIPVANKAEKPVSRLYVTGNNPRLVVCQIQKSFGELPLAYALPENSQLDSIVAKVYIDGKLRKNIDLNRGEALREKIDINGASTYKLEFSLPDKSDKSDYIYALEK